MRRNYGTRCALCAVRGACGYFFLVILLAVTLLCRAEDRIQAHSLVPPLLQNFWMNGMQYWAFGRETVVTDNYVKLTDAVANSKGYLWNRLDNRMEQFELNVTVCLRSRVSAWTNPGRASGIGIWYVNTQKVNYLSDAGFFGFQKQFTGVGVVLDYDGTLSLIRNDGTSTLEPELLSAVASGSCSVNVHREQCATLSLRYANNELRVYKISHTMPDVVSDPVTEAEECGVISHLPLSGEYHFGVTAANGQGSLASYHVHRIVMTPLLEKDMHELKTRLGKDAHINFFGHDQAANSKPQVQ